MMVAVNPSWFYSVQPSKFSQLMSNDVFEGVYEPGMKHDLRQAVSQQITRNSFLMIREPI
jgi:hypothetical protein